MDLERIDSLRVEAQTLLGIGLKTLQHLVDQDSLVDLNHQAYVQQAIQVFKAESMKLERLDVVLAVVGTMKAGKSTTINAIVGREILPNRNAPMTAIPTLIKHVKGQKQPRLRFTPQASQPANQLIQDLRSAFKNNQYAAVLENLKSDQDLYRTIKTIQHSAKVIHEAAGEKQIFDFLASINDLVRIAPYFDLEFPFDQYQQVEQFPVIEVEFAHLSEIETSAGQLILMDTPGPNEAGQIHLRPMLQDQLKKASAVLAVMDYTQLKSEADAQVREDLHSIANTAQGRIYALVNKFDNCDRNGMQEAEVKEFVEGLTEGLIQKESVYPAAAKWAYLANRARYEHLEDGSLPSVNDDNTWVEDFYQEAGLRREAHRTPERIAEAIEDLWQDSKFHHPLKEVIEASHKNAAFVALDSAVAKLEDYIAHLGPFIFNSKQSLCIEQEREASDLLFISIQKSIKTLECVLLKNTHSFYAKQRQVILELQLSQIQIFEKHKQLLDLISQDQDQDQEQDLLQVNMIFLKKSTQALRQRLHDMT